MPAKKDEIIGALSKEQMIEPGGKVTTWMNPIRRASGFGRWVYCKYCHRNVAPRLGGINQVTCGECGAGLSPDFFNLDLLREWWPLWLRHLREPVSEDSRKRFITRFSKRLDAVQR